MPPEDTGAAPPPGAVVLLADLLLGSRVRDTLKRMSIRAEFPGSPPELEEAWRRPALLVIVDLSEGRLDPIGAIRRASGLGIPVLAFGSHVDRERLEAASAAGADTVVPRSTFASRLEELISSLAGGEATA